MDFLSDYGLYLAKFATASILIIFTVLIVSLILMRNKQNNDGNIELKNLNQKYQDMQLELNSQLLDKDQLKQYLKDEKNKGKQNKKEKTEKDRLFSINFKGDIKASDVSNLREEISAILTVAKDKDEVIVHIESGGGTVHGYGLGASQLQRIKDKGIKLTASVDKVAASGGYMMACVADNIIAAPFALIGSIGVLAQIPNFNKLLKRMDIDFEQLSAGEYKRTLSLFGENTEEDRKKVQEELEDTHILFKEFVSANRPVVEIDKIATGEHWYGQRALALKLIDEIQTSDDYLMQAIQDKDVYEIKQQTKQSLQEKVFGFGANILNRLS